MKLSKIYSNNKKLKTINFNDGLNVILATIKDPLNRKKDTHNLGKTTLSKLINFCLLKTIDKDFFLLKNKSTFLNFDFYLEIKTNSNKYLTIKRGTSHSSKISIIKHDKPNQDFSNLDGENNWHHWNIPIERAKSIIDNIISLKDFNNWDYRDAVGYSLRIQNDYNDVFQLDKFRGKHSTWKPFLAQLIGLDGHSLQKKYLFEEEAAILKSEESWREKELAEYNNSPDLIKNLIIQKNKEISDFNSKLKSYDFNTVEKDINQDLIDRIEKQISSFNSERYSLTLAIDRIKDSIDEKVAFDINKITSIFEEAKLTLPTLLKKNYKDLVAFNKDLIKERKKYLIRDLRDYEYELSQVNSRLKSLNKQRVEALSTLKEVETFKKYKKISNRLVILNSELEKLNRAKNEVEIIKNIKKKIADNKRDSNDLIIKLEEDLSSSETYTNLQSTFSDIVNRTLNQNGHLYTTINKEGNYDFKAEILSVSGTKTSKDEGYSYRKFLCIAFDLTILKSYKEKNYIKFAYHDGIFESLDNRKKLNLIEVVRSLCEEGIQLIITAIDSDLPVCDNKEPFTFFEDEIVCNLDDSGDKGRLFMMPEW